MTTKTEFNTVPELNTTLKEMWKINNKVAKGEQPTKEEVDFFNGHLDVIESYYTSRSHYWKIQTGLKYVPPKIQSPQASIE